MGICRILGLIVFAFALFAAPANAAVTITFYSHDLRLIDGFNTDFPHAFVVLSGTDAGGAVVHKQLGFSARNIFVNVLWEPVDGAFDDNELTDAYIAQAVKHFSFTLTEAQYRAVLGVEAKWRAWPQPSYDIDTHNCVTFVKEVAAAAGLAVSDDRKFVRDPKAFLDDVALRNAKFLATPAPALAPVAMPDTAGGLRVQPLDHDAAAQKAD